MNCSRNDWSVQRFCSISCSSKLQYQKKIAKFQFKLGQKALNPIKRGQHLSSETEFKKGFLPWNKNKTIRETRNCGYCKKQFLAHLSGKGLYCSHKCRGLAQRSDNPWKECLICKKSFQKNRNIKHWEDKKYCSKKCQFISQRETFSGENNPRWKGGISSLINQIRGLREYRNWIREVFRQHNYTCQLCGVRSGNGKKVILNADHYPKAFSIIIKENKIDSIEKALECEELWNLENGRTLCIACHKIETAKLKKTL